jgi:MurNAc alpha-1-phosphate uridylyltransferase
MTAKSAMILAAGRGERLAPLTDVTPKPLIALRGKTLIEHHLLALERAGVAQVTVNVAHLGERIVDHLDRFKSHALEIIVSHEPPGALETAGGIHKALELIQSDPFIVVNADVWTDFPFSTLPDTINTDAHLVLVPNPPHHPDGDFSLHNSFVEIKQGASGTLTYAGIGLYRKSLFAKHSGGRLPLAPLLNQAAEDGRLSGQLYHGRWMDIGTPQRLAEARERADLDAQPS